MQKIMIVEDDEIIASSIKKHLEKWNYDVFVVNDFENVLEDFRNYEPLLILLEVSGNKKRIRSAYYLYFFYK